MPTKKKPEPWDVRAARALWHVNIVMMWACGMGLVLLSLG